MGIARVELLRGMLNPVNRERARREATAAAADEEARSAFVGELQAIAGRIAATGGPRTDDLSIAERMAYLLFLPLSEAERRDHEAAVDDFFRSLSEV